MRVVGRGRLAAIAVAPAAILALLVPAASAIAATAGVSGGTLTFTAGGGEPNDSDDRDATDRTSG